MRFVLTFPLLLTGILVSPKGPETSGGVHVTDLKKETKKKPVYMFKTVFAPGSPKKGEFRTFEKFVPSLSKK
jgi:hypothetical protein